MTQLQTRPVLGIPSKWSFPAFESQTLSTGLELKSSHIPGKQLVCAELLLPHTSAQDPQGKEGLTALTAALLDEGTQSRDASSFADALELLGASWYAGASTSGLSVGIEVPAPNLRPAMLLLAEAVTSASIPEREYDRVLAQMLNVIRNQHASPSARARLGYLTSIWDPSTRAALPGNGSAETLPNATRADVIDLVGKFSPQGSTLLIAGDVGGTDIGALAESVFSSWTTPPASRAETSLDLAGTPRLLVIDRPGSVQTELMLGGVVPDRLSSHWASMQVGSHILGGTLTSRIDAVLREEKGYTYGMRSAISPRPKSASWSVGGSVDTPSTLPAVADLLQLLSDAKEGVRAEEVAASAAYLVGVSPLRWETPQDVVGQASGLVGVGLDPSWIDEFLLGMHEATVSSVNAALNVMPLTGMSVVAVGEASLIAEELGSITGLTPEVLEH